MKKIFFILIFILILSKCLESSASIIGSTVDPSLNAFGARAIGMGLSNVAIADDGNAIFINAAGLGFSKYLQLSATSATLLTQVSNNSFALVLPSDWGTFGLGIVDQNLGNSIPTVRDTSDAGRIIANPSGEANQYENSVLFLSYSKTVLKNLSLGLNLKYFNQYMSGTGITGGRGHGSNIDLGVLYKFKPWLSFGYTIQNFLSNTLKWDGTNIDEAMPGFSKAGFAGKIMGHGGLISREAHQVLVSCDYFVPNSAYILQNKASSLHLGLEYKMYNMLSVRLGSDSGTMSYGVGLEQSGFRFDYAFKPTPDLAGYATHYFTLSYIGFTPKPIIVSKEAASIKKEPIQIKIIEPVNRLITTQSIVKVFAQTNSKTKSAFRVNKLETIFTTRESFEIYEKLNIGKNKITIEAITSAESVITSAEAILLRAVPYKDKVTNNVYLLSSMGILKGNPDGGFYPENALTRSELVTLLLRANGIKPDKISKSKFNDVHASHWAAPYIETAVASGLVKGFPDGSFKPEKPLSRVEAISVIVRYSNLMDITLDKGYKPYPDLTADFWGNKDIEKAKRAGYLDYMEGKPFEPNKKFTRGETVEMLVKTPQMLKKIEDFWNN